MTSMRGRREERRSVVTRIRDRLLADAPLFDDPGAYRAGVLDAIAAFEEEPSARAPRDRSGGRSLAGGPSR